MPKTERPFRLERPRPTYASQSVPYRSGDPR